MIYYDLIYCISDMRKYVFLKDLLEDDYSHFYNVKNKLCSDIFNHQYNVKHRVVSKHDGSSSPHFSLVITV